MSRQASLGRAGRFWLPTRVSTPAFRGEAQRAAEQRAMASRGRGRGKCAASGQGRRVMRARDAEQRAGVGAHKIRRAPPGFREAPSPTLVRRGTCRKESGTGSARRHEGALEPAKGRSVKLGCARKRARYVEQAAPHEQREDRGSKNPKEEESEKRGNPRRRRKARGNRIGGARRSERRADLVAVGEGGRRVFEASSGDFTLPEFRERSG